jgi:hypothetical protein
MNIEKGFNLVKNEYVNYFRPYTFEKPIIFTRQTNQELRSLGRILYKAIAYFLVHYEDFLTFMPRCERDLEIIEICRKYPYRVGTFRADFVVDSNNQIKIIEMTTRQPLNGYFVSGFFREIALEQVDRWRIDDIDDCYPAFFKYLENYIGNATHICVIKGNNKLEEMNIYPQIFENAGIPCHIIPLKELSEKLPLLKNAWVIEELTFDEIRNIPIEIIEELAQIPMHNNFMSLLHTHDKRFISLLSNKLFLNSILDEAEQEILLKHIVPTYMLGENQAVWNDAFENKEKYILKHQHKGKSVDVYAGIVTDEDVWKSLFNTGIIKEFVLQNFVAPKFFNGNIGDEKRHDYVAGTLLYFNEEYFGPGVYRASSYPVSNIKDNRKIAQLVVNTDTTKENFHYL